MLPASLRKYQITLTLISVLAYNRILFTRNSPILCSRTYQQPKQELRACCHHPINILFLSVQNWQIEGVSALLLVLPTEQICTYKRNRYNPELTIIEGLNSKRFYLPLESISTFSLFAFTQSQMNALERKSKRFKSSWPVIITDRAHKYIFKTHKNI